jgi:lysophospholipase L1-like esterase
MSSQHVLSLIVVSAVGAASVACSSGVGHAGSAGSAGTAVSDAGHDGAAAGSAGGVATDGPARDSAAGADVEAAGDGQHGQDGPASDGAAGSDGEPDTGSSLEAGSDGSMTNRVWTGTWASSPQGCSGEFSQRTMREIVHTSIGGTSARVRISNTFSGGALQIRDVHLAQRLTGSSIDPTTDEAVLFNGQPDVTIAAGMFAVSDGAEFTVTALSDVAVSFYVVSNDGATCHQSGFQTNYSVAGNIVSSATLAGAQTNGSYYFLSNLDVVNPGAEGAVVALGASITDGYVSPSDANRRWPNDLAARLAMGDRVMGVLNQGISGDGVKNAVMRFDRDVLSQPDVKWVIFSDNPINDLGNFDPPAQTEIDQMSMMIASAHSHGVRFLCSTLTPFQGASYWSAQKEIGRAAINAFIRGAGSGCDGVVDQDTATHDPANPTTYLPTFNSGDGLHPNVAGLQAIAEAVDLASFK